MVITDRVATKIFWPLLIFLFFINIRSLLRSEQNLELAKLKRAHKLFDLMGFKPTT